MSNLHYHDFKQVNYSPMNSIKITLIGSLLGFTSILLAQTTLPVPRNIQTAYEKGTRSPVGIPAKNYWQNFAAYNIQIRFDPVTRLISGTEDITYTNNSPDTLKEIVFKLNPNIYKKGAVRYWKIDSADLSSGVKISKFVIDKVSKPTEELLIDGTVMQVPISPLSPKQSMHLNIGFSYVLNKGSHIRTGEVDSGAWFLAYFFPRIAVYDDIDGWDMNPYIGGMTEFYNDFCNFKIGVTVPKDYVVWATGDLQNCTEVFTPKYCELLSIAERADGITTIIDSTDLKVGNITANNPENTFRFEATNVTDVAVAISNHYIWKSSSLVVDSTTGRRTRVDAVFNPQHKDFYEVVDFARKTVESMSFRFPRWPFPYSHETVFNGLAGCEYPMMVNDISLESREETINLTLHEVFHTMFPFYMGTNETKYGWMDEGWAQMSNWIIPPMIDSAEKCNYFVGDLVYYYECAGMEVDLPIITLTTQLYGLAIPINSYFKPALGYIYVKDLLGDDLFYKGLHNYFRNWNGKHPIPYDFFNSMNVGSGVNLNWFWNRWFFERGVPDLAIGKFTDGKKEKSIVVEMKGEKPLPIDLSILFTDGTIQNIHRSTGVWELGNKVVEIKFASSKKVKEITLGSPIVPDVNKKDNHLVLGT
jgi:hypothetical protein